MTHEILKLPNLISLSRVFLTPVIGYYLYLGDFHSSLIAMVLLIVAGLTDFLDGFVARKMGLVGELGIALDPVCDKIFAGVLTILLVIFRELPIWLAGIIVGRDLLIMVVGLFLMRDRKITLPSILTGKIAFCAIAVLLASYVIRFPFGIWMVGPIAIALMAGSTVGYARVFWFVRQGKTPPQFIDKPIYFLLRWVIIVGLSVWFLYELYLYLLT